MLHCSAHFFSSPVSFPTNPDDALLQWNPGTKMYAIQLALCMMWYCHLTSGEKRASIFFFILYFAGITHITIPYPDCANANPGCLYFNRPSSDSEINVNTQVFSVLSSSSLTTVSLSLSLWAWLCYSLPPKSKSVSVILGKRFVRRCTSVGAGLYKYQATMIFTDVRCMNIWLYLKTECSKRKAGRGCVVHAGLCL